MFHPLSPLRPMRSALAGLLLLAYLPACSSWHIGTPTPASFLLQEHPQRARIRWTNDSLLVVLAPQVHGDSLIAQLPGPNAARIAIPLSQVRSVELRRFSAGKTLLLAGGVVGVGVVAWVIDCSGRTGWDAIGCP